MKHQWTDRDGRRWECDAYDHGPFCRQCTLVPDDVEAAIAENLRLGRIELVGVNEDGEPTYRVTASGEAHLRSLGVDPEVPDA